MCCTLRICRRVLSQQNCYPFNVLIQTVWDVVQLQSIFIRSMVLCASHTQPVSQSLGKRANRTSERTKERKNERTSERTGELTDEQEMKRTRYRKTQIIFHIAQLWLGIAPFTETFYICSPYACRKRKNEATPTHYTTPISAYSILLHGMSCRCAYHWRVVCCWYWYWRAAVSSIFTKLRLLTPLNQLKLMSSNVVALVYVNSYSFNFPLLQPLSFHFSVIASEQQWSERSEKNLQDSG